MRDSAILVRELAKYDKSIRKSILNPSTNLSVSIINYVGINAEAILKRKEGPINKIISKKDKAQEEELITGVEDDIFIDELAAEVEEDIFIEELAAEFGEGESVEEVTAIDDPVANAKKVVKQGGVNQ